MKNNIEKMPLQLKQIIIDQEFVKKCQGGYSNSSREKELIRKNDTTRVLTLAENYPDVRT